MKCLAIILARGGSKRIPRKNVRRFLGRPMLEYAVHSAIKSGCFEEVMLSTDDEEIAEAARNAGASTPFKRSAENARDEAPTGCAVLEVISKYREAGRNFDAICALYASSPLICSEHLRTGYKMLEANPCIATIMPVVRFSHPVQRAFAICDGNLRMTSPEHEFTRSQDLAPRYHDAGQWYWLRTALFLQSRQIFGNPCMPLILSDLEVQDVDTEDDWKLAEIKFRLRNTEQSQARLAVMESCANILGNDVDT